MALSEITKSNLEYNNGTLCATVRGFEVVTEDRGAKGYHASIFVLWDDTGDSDAHVTIGKTCGCTIGELKTEIMELINDLPMNRKAVATLAQRLDFTGDIETLFLIKDAESAPQECRNETLERVQSMSRVYEKYNRALAFCRKTKIEFTDCGQCAYVILDHKVWLLRREQFGTFTFTHETDLARWLQLGGNIHDLTITK